MIKLLSSDDILNLGETDSAKWFRNAEKIWKENKTEKSEKISSLDRLNFQKGITDQDLNKKYIVLYNSSAKDANSTILIRHNYELDFIVESSAYAFYTNSLEEANYINCFLNCSYANTIIKDFQVRGLYEARDVHKKILEVPFPQYNRKNKSHTDLAELGEVCYKKTKIFLGDNVKEDLAPHRLRALRLE